MAEISRTRVIAAPPAQIWKVLADFGAISAWATNVTHSEVTTPATDGVGATRRIQAGNQTLLERVVEWRPGEELAYELIGLPRVVREAENRWTLRPVGEACEVSLTSSVWTGPRPPQQAVAAVIARVLGRVGEELLDGLEKRIEEDTRARV